jgi:pSer/pThr/pTyr-binding forkhead associated (FHA) protein
MENYVEEVALLVGQAGPLDGERWALSSSIIVGRDPKCEIVIPDRQVSRRHAKFTPTSEGILLEDLGSKNGTHRNGKPIFKPTLLKDGDIIQIALTQQFLFLSSDATVPLDVSSIDLEKTRLTSNEPAQDTQSEKRRLYLDPRSRRVWLTIKDEKPITQANKPALLPKEIVPPLSVYQFRLLKLLYDREDQVVPRMELIAKVWGQEQAIEVSEQALDALVRRLRDRLAEVDSTHSYIVTVRGHGLRLDNPPIPE